MLDASLAADAFCKMHLYKIVVLDTQLAHIVSNVISIEKTIRANMHTNQSCSHKFKTHYKYIHLMVMLVVLIIPVCVFAADANPIFSKTDLY